MCKSKKKQQVTVIIATPSKKSDTEWCCIHGLHLVCPFGTFKDKHGRLLTIWSIRMTLKKASLIIEVMISKVQAEALFNCDIVGDNSDEII